MNVLKKRVYRVPQLEKQVENMVNFMDKAVMVLSVALFFIVLSHQNPFQSNPVAFLLFGAISLRVMSEIIGWMVFDTGSENKDLMVNATAFFLLFFVIPSLFLSETLLLQYMFTALFMTFVFKPYRKYSRTIIRSLISKIVKKGIKNPI